MDIKQEIDEYIESKAVKPPSSDYLYGFSEYFKEKSFDEKNINGYIYHTFTTSKKAGARMVAVKKFFIHLYRTGKIESALYLKVIEKVW